MQIEKRNIGLTVDDSLMRVYVAAPQLAGQYPGYLVLFRYLSVG